MVSAVLLAYVAVNLAVAGHTSITVDEVHHFDYGRRVLNGQPERRAVYDNIRRFAGYHFCSNVGELIPFLVWGVTGGAVPLPLVVMFTVTPVRTSPASEISVPDVSPPGLLVV